MSSSPISGCVERWHALLRGDLAGGFDAILHADCTFYSPIVFSPQRGRDITKLYLQAAGNILADADLDAGRPALDEDGPFRYVKEVLDGHHAVLEFETTVDVDGAPTYVNGVDIITCDDESRIVEFKVMIRPLKAVTLVHERMRAMLERFSD